VSRFGPGKVSSFTRALLHPMETLKTYRAAITRRISKSDFSPANGEKGVD
jgi:hypothetical protein